VTRLAPQIAGERGIFVKRDPHRIVGEERRDEPIAARHVVALLGKRAEQPVEYDQHAAVIPVEIFGVRGVVDAVTRRRVQHPFERAEPRRPA
jgi:hypothetical protein